MSIANIVILLVTSMSDIISINTTALSPRLPVLASSFQAGSSKYCRASRAQKWLYLSRNNSESSDSSCVGFPAGPTITRKLIFDRFKVQLHNMSVDSLCNTVTPEKSTLASMALSWDSKRKRNTLFLSFGIYCLIARVYKKS